jgi:dephospho-CoA kinase
LGVSLNLFYSFETHYVKLYIKRTTAEEVKKRMAAQMSDVERRSRADFVIINNNIQPLLPQVKAIVALLL